MTKEIFSALPLKLKCNLLLEEGQFLDSINYYQFKSNLYALSSFFVEILCYQESTDIEKIQIVNEDNLIKYLNRIDVTSLLNG